MKMISRPTSKRSKGSCESAIKTNQQIQIQHQEGSKKEEYIRVKLITIGCVKVGKSCLIKKYCEKNRFVSNYIPTIGVDYGVKPATVRMGDEELNIKIDFFDFSGEPDYVEIRNEFYNDVDGVLLMYDVTNKQSFESLHEWLQEAAKYGVSPNNSKIVVVGNKIDEYPRAITELQGTSFAAENNSTYFETSALTGASVDDMFEFLTKEICKDKRSKSGK